MARRKNNSNGRPPIPISVSVLKMLGRLSDPEVAKKAAVSVSTVLRWRQSRGILEHRLIPEKVEWTEPDTGKKYNGLDALRWLHRLRKGKGFAKVCADIGITESAGYRWSRQLGLTWMQGRPPETTSALRRRVVRALYGKFTCKEIGDVLRLSPQRVQQISG